MLAVHRAPHGVSMERQPCPRARAEARERGVVSCRRPIHSSLVSRPRCFSRHSSSDGSTQPGFQKWMSRWMTGRPVLADSARENVLLPAPAMPRPRRVGRQKSQLEQPPTDRGDSVKPSSGTPAHVAGSGRGRRVCEMALVLRKARHGHGVQARPASHSLLCGGRTTRSRRRLRKMDGPMERSESWESASGAVRPPEMCTGSGCRRLDNTSGLCLVRALALAPGDTVRADCRGRLRRGWC